MGFDEDKPKSGTKSKIPRKRIEQIEQYVEEKMTMQSSSQGN